MKISIKYLMGNLKKEDRLFFVVLLLYLVLNVIFFSSYSIAGDDAFLGVVAKHISEGKVFPFFVYTVPYSGGAAMFSYILSLNFLVFGLGIFAYRLAVVILSSIFLILVYLFCGRFFNKQIGLISSLMFVLPPTGLIFLNVIWGDYLLAIMINFILVFVFYEIFFHNKKRPYFILLGLVAAFAYYALEYAIPIIVTCLLVLFFMKRKFFKTKEFWLAVGSFAVGMVPLLIYNVTHNFENIKHLLAGTFVHKIVCKLHLIPETVYFGSKMVSHCDVFVKTKGKLDLGVLVSKSLPQFFGHIYYFIFFFALAFLIWFVFSKYKTKVDKRNFRYFWLVIYVLLFLVLYTLSGFSDTKHLLPLYPYILIIIGLFAYNIKKINKLTFIILLSIILLGGVLNTTGLSRNHKNFAQSDEMTRLVEELNKRDIKFVYAPYESKWGVIFNSNENIIASCEGMCICGGSGADSRYTLHEKMVRDSGEYNYLVPIGMIEKTSTYKYVRVGNYYLYPGLKKGDINRIMSCN